MTDPGKEPLTSPEVMVAVVDTGVDLAHPDLSAHVAHAATGEVLGTNLVTPGQPPTDDNGHGTHLAGIILRESAGKALLMPVKVLRAEGRGRISDVAAGIRWAADHGARVICVSIGTPAYRTDLADAVGHAWQQGALVVAAAGNDGADEVVYPAGNLFAIGVGAAAADGKPAAFSNKGIHVSLIAPGESVDSALPTYPVYATRYGFPLNHGRLTGTSQAAAWVAGVAAKQWAGDRSLTPGEMYGRLLAMAAPADGQRWTAAGGYGLLRSTGTVPSRPARGGSIYGQVRDAHGEPCKDVTIIVGDTRVAAGETGLFRITDLAPGIYRVQIDHPALRFAGEVTVRPDQETLLSIDLFAEAIAFTGNLAQR